jgi:hypothetical protein
MKRSGLKYPSYYPAYIYGFFARLRRTQNDNMGLSGLILFNRRINKRSPPDRCTSARDNCSSNTRHTHSLEDLPANPHPRLPFRHTRFQPLPIGWPAEMAFLNILTQIAIGLSACIGYIVPFLSTSPEPSLICRKRCKLTGCICIGHASTASSRNPSGTLPPAPSSFCQCKRKRNARHG